MRKKFFIIIAVVFFTTSALEAQLRVGDDSYVQIGYDEYATLSFGRETCALPYANHGKYAIEYWGEEGNMQGLNFWKPWPTPNHTNYVLFLRDDKNVGIGTSGSGSYKLDLAGTIRSYGSVIFSDERLKTNVTSMSNSLDKVLLLNGVSYNYEFELDKYSSSSDSAFEKAKINTVKGDSKISPSDKKEHIGFIAQDLQEVLPNIVYEDENGYLSVNYNEVIPLLVEAMKEQQTQIEILENSIEELKNNGKKAISFEEKESSMINDSKLYQNSPNPFNKQTEILFFIPNETRNASIIIHDMQGTQKKQYNIVQKGNSTIKINASEFIAGLYTYSLVVDGVLIDTKKMLLLKK